MKVKISQLGEKERIATLDALYTAASSVRGRGAVKLFLRDLLTPSERIMLGRRIIIARMLLGGESQREITRRLGVGQDTVHKVSVWLEDQLPGYEQAIAGLEEEYDKREEKRLYATSAMYRLKKKYPMHFLLFPAPKPKRGNSARKRFFK
ncbi:MAG: Trp family transcriptional regulator [Parcubacteria group bacterium]